MDMQNRWYETKVLPGSSTMMFAIKECETEELIGCCGLCYINWVHRNADLSFVYWKRSGVYRQGRVCQGELSASI